MLKRPKSVDFSNAAKVYDSTRSIPDNVIEQAIIILESNKHIRKKSKLLDIGCGTGQLTKIFAEKDYLCTGIDISKNMLNIAKQKKMKNAEFFLGDARDISFHDNDFDICISSKLFLHIEDWQKAINEILRVLKDHGCFIYLNEIGYFNNDIRKHFRQLADKNGFRHRFLGEYDLNKIAHYFISIGLNHKHYQAPELSWKKEISYNEAYKEIENKSFAEFWMIPEKVYNNMLKDTSDWVKVQNGSWETIQVMHPELILDVFWK